MAVNKHNEDPLEQLFKNKLNKFDISYNKADWEDMEQRLDQVDKMLLLKKQNNMKKKRFAAAAILLLVLAGLSFIIYDSYNKIDELETKLRQQKIENRSNNLLADEEAEGNQNSIIESNRTDKNNSPSTKGDAKQKNQFLPNKNRPLVEIQVDINSTNPPDNNNETQDLFNPLWASHIPSANIQPATVYNPIDNSIDIQLSYTSDPASKDKNTVITAALGMNYHSSKATNIENTYRASSGFAVGLIIGPDFSTVGSLSNFYTPGFKIGAVAEYNWNKHFGISGGLIYSKVNYTASKNEYKPPYGFWDNGTVPQETTAACTILSIPIHLKYNVVHFNDSRFYITAGVSSYIMLNEGYQFNYAQNNESGLVQNWNGQTGNRYWLSNATLSIGYEFDLNASLSLRIEPYLNIPIRRVGWGNVELFSTGSFISLNYHFH